MSNRPVAKNKAASQAGGPKKQHYGYTPQAIGPDKQSKPMGLWIGLGMLGLAALIGVVVAVVAGDSGPTESVTQSVTVSGTRLPSVPGDSTGPIVTNDPAAGLKIPTLSGSGFNGSPINIGPGSGGDDGGQLIVFLAHWCPHCQAEVPKIVAKRTDGSIPDTIKVTAVSTGVDKTRGNYPPASWLEKEQWTDPVMADDKDGKAGQAFGIGGFPYMLAVDKDGKVVKRSSGELTDEQMQEMVDAAAGTTVVTPAPAAPAS